MLNKELYKKCLKEYWNKGSWKWNETDELRWNKQKWVHCPKKYVNRKVTFVTERPSSFCPFYLEHLVQEV